MFQVTTIDNALRGQILEAERANDEHRLLDLARLVPLNEQLSRICQVLSLSPDHVLSLRNSEYQRSLREGVAWPDLNDEQARKLAMLGKIVLRETDTATLTEAALELASGRLAAEYGALLQRLHRTASN